MTGSFQRFFRHFGETEPPELADVLTANGVANVNHGSTNIHAVVESVKQGNPAITLIGNADGGGHWVLIDDVLPFDGINLLAIRDAASGRAGYMSMTDFDIKCFSQASKAVWIS